MGKLSGDCGRDFGVEAEDLSFEFSFLRDGMKRQVQRHTEEPVKW